MRFAQAVLQDILNSAHRTDTDELIRQAERILELIRARDFSYENSNAQDELRMAQDGESRSHTVSKVICGSVCIGIIIENISIVDFDSIIYTYELLQFELMFERGLFRIHRGVSVG